MHRSAALLCLWALGANALRRSTNSTKKTSISSTNETSISSLGRVANLLTYGQPMVAAPALSDPASSDGCFSGFRYVNREVRLVYRVDIVPPLLKTSPYAHNKINISFLDQNNGSELRECGWVGWTVERPSVSLHDMQEYRDRAVMQGGPFVDAAKVALGVSYTFDTEEAAEFVAMQGYRLVGTAVVNDEASHLIQNPSTLACFITFEGTTGWADWTLNIQILRSDFCGLGQQVHNGFREATLRIVDTDEFQQHVRPKLGKCSKVEAVGHSLGGAIASLFTACAHNSVKAGEPGFDDYLKFYWNKQSNQLMPGI